MSWKDLLQKFDQHVVLPWVGGSSLISFERSWHITKLPIEHGWHKFNTYARTADWACSSPPNTDILRNKQVGYLVGNLFVPDNSSNVTANIKELVKNFRPVNFIEPGIDRFQRVSVGCFYENSPLIYEGLQFPLGPEESVLQAFLDQKENINSISGITPALDVAFKFETWQRDEAERIRKEEQERREKEQRRRELERQFGNSVTRREVALVDFGAAVKAALGLSNTTYLDHRAGPNRNEMIVRFRLDGRRFECVCHKETLRIIDSGICLRDERRGIAGDTWLSMESLPSVIREAIDEERLVIFRHA